MRISPSSPLYRVPLTLIPKQRLLVEGICYSINMAFLSWEQLKLILQNITSKKSMEQDKYAAFLFAWSVVDNLDRLKTLLSHLRAVGFEDLYASVENLRAMRNTYHHICDRVDASLDVNYPLIGTLSWTYMETEGQNFLEVSILASGNHAENREYETLNPLGQSVDLPIGMVTLTSVICERGTDKKIQSAKTKINLSNVMNELHVAITNFEQLLENKFNEISSVRDYIQQDLLMGYTIEFN